jgi:hypothetical protein
MKKVFKINTTEHSNSEDNIRILNDENINLFQEIEYFFNTPKTSDS